MTGAFLILAVAAAATLAISGIGQVRSPTTQHELEDLRVPSWLRWPALVRAHPWVELLLAIGLLATSGWPLSVLAAANLLLMVGYTVLVARAVRAGDSTSCNCFGDIFDTKLTGRSVVRNVVLCVVAAAVLAGAVYGQSVIGLLIADPGVALPLLAAALLVLLTWATVTSPATTEPAFEPDETAMEDYQRLQIPLAWIRETSGPRHTLRELAAQRARLLIFLSPGCDACASIAEELPAWIEDFPMLAVHPVFFVGPQMALETHPELAPYALFEEEIEVSRVLGVASYPAAVILGTDGLLAGGPVVGPKAIRAIVDELREQFAPAD